LQSRRVASLLRQFEARILNVHLGLSPYYRGTGTNFWPLVEGCPEYVGATFMHMDEGVDTGAIIHQIRAEIRPHDTQHQIGNRLIRDVSLVYPAIIRAFKTLAPMPQIPRSAGDRLCRRKDLTAAAVEQAQRNFTDGMIGKYLADKEERDSRVPIVQHPAIPALRDLQGWGA
jgi:methionyl-tRNA formyltransferase